MDIYRTVSLQIQITDSRTLILGFCGEVIWIIFCSLTTTSSCEEYDGEIDNRMSSFLGRLFKGGANKKKKENKHPHLKRNQNPFDIWTNVGELGDGAFGKVYKVLLLLTSGCIIIQKRRYELHVTDTLSVCDHLFEDHGQSPLYTVNQFSLVCLRSLYRWTFFLFCSCIM